MSKTCVVQFCRLNANKEYKTTGGKRYMYNFPDEFAVLGNVYDIETNITYSNPVIIISVLEENYPYITSSDRPTFDADSYNTKIKDVKRIKKILKGTPNYSLIADKLNESPVKDYCDYETIKNNKNNKENVSMKKNMFGMDFEFGKVPAGKFKMSFMGLAFATGDGRYATYNIAENEFTDVTEMTMNADGMIMQMPCASKDVMIGDIIKHKDAYVIVKGGNEGGGIVAVNPFKSEEITIIPTKNMFGFNFVTKVVNVFGDMFKTSEVAPSEDNPFGNIMPFIMMSGMSDGDVGMTGDSGNSMMKMMMMSQMMGGQSMDFSKNPMMMYMFMQNM